MALIQHGLSIYQILLTLMTTALCTELVPERYLRPRDFNHHPFTDVGVPAALKTAPRLPSTHPYAILATKRPREGRQFPQQDVIIYPSPHPSVLPRKVHEEPLDTVETNEIGYDSDPYVNVPKNYAFSYSVKDQQSGDDFSHSQAHNGKATRGQYRVKLPDGRVQVVSYTADHKGYRADVQYEEDPTALHAVQAVHSNNALFRPAPQHLVPETPTALPRHSPNTLYDTYEQQRQQQEQHEEHQQRTAQVTPVQFPQSPPENAAPEAQVQDVNVYPSPAPAYQARHNYQYIPRFVEQEYLHATTPSPEDEYSHNTVSPSPGPLRIILAQANPDDPFIREKYVSTTAAPYHEQEHDGQDGHHENYFVSTTAGYLSTAEPYRHYESSSYHEDPNNQHSYLAESSSIAPPAAAQVLVTPRTLFKPHGHNQRQPLLIRYVKKR